MSFPRYLAYKDSGVAWLGSVPEHWRVGRLKHIATVFPSNVDKKSYDGDAPVRLCNYTDVYYNDEIREDMDLMIATATAEQIEKFSLRAGDTIITKDSETADDIAISAYVPNGLPGVVCGYHLSMVRPKPVADGRFLKRFFDSQVAKGQAAVSANGLTRVGLGQYAIDNLHIAAPPVEEQLIIGDFLDRETAKIDALVAEQEQLITLLKEKRQAVISHAVTKGLDPSVPMKVSGVEWLGDVPADWNVSPLKFLALIGNGSTPNRDDPNYWTEDGFPWLNSSVVNQSEVSEAERFVTATALKECHLPIIEPPAVLVGITGQGKTRGMAAPLTFTATVNQHLAYIKPDQDRLDIGYLLRALEAAYEHLRTESEGAGSTKGAITCGQLGAWLIPVPALVVQAEIVLFLDEELSKLDVLTTEAERAIGLLMERRSALISAAVTGQIDVRALAPSQAAA